MQTGAGTPESNPTISVCHVLLTAHMCEYTFYMQADFKVPLVTMSGLKVSRLDIYGEVHTNTSCYTVVVFLHF